jgi:hypothetical protein
MSKVEYDDWRHLNDGSRNLQDPLKKTRILPDENLSRLLRVDEYKDRIARGEEYYKNGKELVPDDHIYYWTIQRLLKRHFIKDKKLPEKVVEKHVEFVPATPAPVKSYRSKRDSYNLRRSSQPEP